MTSRTTVAGVPATDGGLRPVERRFGVRRRASPELDWVGRLRLPRQALVAPAPRVRARDVLPRTASMDRLGLVDRPEQSQGSKLPKCRVFVKGLSICFASLESICSCTGPGSSWQYLRFRAEKAGTPLSPGTDWSTWPYS